MTRFDVGVVSLRILVLYVWYQCIRSICELTYLLADGRGPSPSSEQILGMLLSLLLLAGFGLLLYRSSRAIAGRVLPGGDSASSASRTEIGTLALKIVGLLVLADFIQDLGRLPYYLIHSKDQFLGNLLEARLLMTALMGACSALLIRAAPRLSRWLFGSAAEALDATLLARVQAVAFSVLGVYLVAISLTPVARQVIENLYTGESWISYTTWSHIAVAVLGLLLVVGGSGLARFWQWLHKAGLAQRTPAVGSGEQAD